MLNIDQVFGSDPWRLIPGADQKGFVWYNSTTGDKRHADPSWQRSFSRTKGNMVWYNASTQQRLVVCPLAPAQAAGAQPSTPPESHRRYWAAQQSQQIQEYTPRPTETPQKISVAALPNNTPQKISATEAAQPMPIKKQRVDEEQPAGLINAKKEEPSAGLINAKKEEPSAGLVKVKSERVDLTEPDELVNVKQKKKIATEPGRQEALRQWLLELDPDGALLEYLEVLEAEFDADFAQIAAARIETMGGIRSQLAQIEPSFFEVLGVKRLGHRLLLAKGILALPHHGASASLQEHGLQTEGVPENPESEVEPILETGGSWY